MSKKKKRRKETLVTVAPSNIKFGKEFGALDFVHDLGDKR
jgi:hypothetical protein